MLTPLILAISTLLPLIASQCCQQLDQKLNLCLSCSPGTHPYRQNCILDIPNCLEHQNGFDCKKCQTDFKLVNVTRGQFTSQRCEPTIKQIEINLDAPEEMGLVGEAYMIANDFTMTIHFGELMGSAVISAVQRVFENGQEQIAIEYETTLNGNTKKFFRVRINIDTQTFFMQQKQFRAINESELRRNLIKIVDQQQKFSTDYEKLDFKERNINLFGINEQRLLEKADNIVKSLGNNYQGIISSKLRTYSDGTEIIYLTYVKEDGQYQQVSVHMSSRVVISVGGKKIGGTPETVKVPPVLSEPTTINQTDIKQAPAANNTTINKTETAVNQTKTQEQTPTANNASNQSSAQNSTVKQTVVVPPVKTETNTTVEPSNKTEIKPTTQTPNVSTTEAAPAVNKTENAQTPNSTAPAVDPKQNETVTKKPIQANSTETPAIPEVNTTPAANTTTTSYKIQTNKTNTPNQVTQNNDTKISQQPVATNQSIPQVPANATQTPSNPTSTASNPPAQSIKNAPSPTQGYTTMSTEELLSDLYFIVAKYAINENLEGFTDLLPYRAYAKTEGDFKKFILLFEKLDGIHEEVIASTNILSYKVQIIKTQQIEPQPTQPPQPQEPAMAFTLIPPSKYASNFLFIVASTKMQQATKGKYSGAEVVEVGQNKEETGYVYFRVVYKAAGTETEVIGKLNSKNYMFELVSQKVLKSGATPPQVPQTPPKNESTPSTATPEKPISNSTTSGNQTSTKNESTPSTATPEKPISNSTTSGNQTSTKNESTTTSSNETTNKSSVSTEANSTQVNQTAVNETKQQISNSSIETQANSTVSPSTNASNPDPNTTSKNTTIDKNATIDKNVTQSKNTTQNKTKTDQNTTATSDVPVNNTNKTIEKDPVNSTAVTQTKPIQTNNTQGQQTKVVETQNATGQVIEQTPSNQSNQVNKTTNLTTNTSDKIDPSTPQVKNDTTVTEKNETNSNIGKNSSTTSSDTNSTQNTTNTNKSSETPTITTTEKQVLQPPKQEPLNPLILAQVSGFSRIPQAELSNDETYTKIDAHVRLVNPELEGFKVIAAFMRNIGFSRSYKIYYEKPSKPTYQAYVSFDVFRNRIFIINFGTIGYSLT